MPITRPANLQTPFATSGTKNTIPVPSQIGITPGAASFTDGFPPLTFTPIAAGGVPPAGADFNGILNELSAHTVFQNAGGKYRFDATLAAAIGGYPVGFVLQDDAGLNEYVNILAANTTNFNSTPASIGVSWIPYSGQTATQSGVNKYAIDTSATANVITAAISPAPLSLVDGMTVKVVPAITNTGAVTFSLNGLTTHPAVNYSGAFTGGELIAGKPYTFTYNLASTSWYVTSSAGGITQSAADLRYALLTAFTTGQVKTTTAGNQPLSGGLVLKTGYITSVAAGATMTVTFPAAFPSAIMFGNIIPTQDSNVAQATPTITGATAAGFTSINRTTITNNFFWFAIGY